MLLASILLRLKRSFAESAGTIVFGMEDGTVSIFGLVFGDAATTSGVSVPEIFHSGQSQFTDMVGGKPLGLTVAWINRRNIALHDSVPRPDQIFPDIASLLRLLDNGG